MYIAIHLHRLAGYACNTPPPRHQADAGTILAVSTYEIG